MELGRRIHPGRETRMQGAGLHSGEPSMVSSQPEPQSSGRREGGPAEDMGLASTGGLMEGLFLKQLCKEGCAFVVCLSIPSWNLCRFKVCELQHLCPARWAPEELWWRPLWVKPRPINCSTPVWHDGHPRSSHGPVLGGLGGLPAGGGPLGRALDGEPCLLLTQLLYFFSHQDVKAFSCLHK